ncbi:hypothetical protein BCR37DRAFT_380474 [Protomyces lactucae-debilis]|uniref:DUF788-domain-containing protein n=1 Tax=Protomyces lactucae-debilis TaxID=2754530 RepID=A0A1Y2FCE3_PROLT|nr:uncharacterized protein BCR37DRAFT_380474 [Protomyces lactucae-debilis]ORY81583.1 hypothetical protein BCR37DRAFT_380474 [Protomyces lactucae-debilis]
MARQAEKQLAKDNTAKIALLRRGAVAVNVLFIVIRLIYCRASSTKKTYFLYLLTNLVAGTIQLQLERIGSPTFNSDGSLRSSGGDLGQAGVTEYLTDIVYMTWIVYLLVTFITDYAWLFYLAIPGYAVYKIWPAIQPRLAQARRQMEQQQAAGGQGQGEGERLSRRQEKLKKKQEKFAGRQ